MAPTLLTLLLWAHLYISACVGQSPWRTLASLPQYTLQEHSTVVLPGSRIATVGGLINIGQWGTTTDLLQIYDVANNRWSQGARLPVALNHPNAAAVGGRVYLLGGMTGGSGWPAVPGTWVYNPQSNSWSALPSMPSNQARGAAAVGVHNNIIYLAGGIPSLNSRSVRTVSAFDTAAGRWISLPAAAQNIPEPRDHVAGAVVGGKFYVVGGRDTGIANVKNSVYVLDLQNLSAGWTTLPAGMPTARAGHSLAASGTRIFTFGGEGNPAPGSSGVFAQVEVLDTATNSWTSLAPMPNPRHGTAAAELNGHIYIPGGGIVEGVGATSHVSAFTVSGTGPVNPPQPPQPPPPPPPPTNCAPLWGQCGGQGWTGPTCCAQGTCRSSNQWYSQCLQ